eukprot:Clim_evm24s34 gene=Clim_evmTU24s34
MPATENTKKALESHLDTIWGEVLDWVDADDWNQVLAGKAVMHEKHVDDTGVPVRRIKQTFDDLPSAEDLIEKLYVLDKSVAKVMEPDLMDRTTLEEWGEHSIVHQMLKTPMIMSNRDLLISVGKRNQGETFGLVSFSCDEFVDDRKAPYKSCVRANSYRGSFVARPVGDNKIEVIRFVQTHAGGNVPAALSNAMKSKWKNQVEQLPKIYAN